MPPCRSIYVAGCSMQLPGIARHRSRPWLRYPKAVGLWRLMLELWFAAYGSRSLLESGSRTLRVVAILPPSAFMTLLPLFRPRQVVTIGILHDLQGVRAKRGRRGWQTAAAGHRLDRKTRLCKLQTSDCVSANTVESAIRLYSLDPTPCSIHYPFLTPPRPTSRQAAARENLLSSDTMHVATALELRCRPFLTFDVLQQQLARVRLRLIGPTYSSASAAPTQSAALRGAWCARPGWTGC